MAESTTKIEVASPAFREGGYIPDKYTCQGENISPPLAWSGAPPDTKSFAVIMDDPDAPGGVWDHWVLFNIPAGTKSLAEGVPSAAVLPDGSCHGINDFRKTGYGGPCPPPGKPHRYVFAVYALDGPLGLKPGAGKEAVLSAMKGRVLAQGELTGLYGR